jgi:hypothetical protein
VVKINLNRSTTYACRSAELPQMDIFFVDSQLCTYQRYSDTVQEPVLHVMVLYLHNQVKKDTAVLPVPKHHVMKVKKYSSKNSDDQSQRLISYSRNILTVHTGWTHNPLSTRWQ